MPIVRFQPLGKTANVPPGAELIEAARKAGVTIITPCGGKGACGKCAVRVVSGKCDSNSLGVLSKTAIHEGFVLACRTRVGEGDLVVEVPPEAGREGGQFVEELGESLIDQNLLPSKAQFAPVTAKPGGTFGIALDIGTTTVALQLVDMASGKVIAAQTEYNDQVTCGLDVISRINYARRQGGLDELRSRVLKTINKLVSEVCKESNVRKDGVCAAALSGNTTMTHLLLGVDPESIRIEPYKPAFLEAPPRTAGQIGIEINPGTNVHIAPAVGSYVGGDITSGLLCTGIPDQKNGVSLFMDIGTNGELVIGNHEFMMGCACSAGPAFEGGGIECGMRAATGAIDRVSVDPKTGVAEYWTIGKVRPLGICGSGMISLLSEMLMTGWIDPSGNLDRSGKCSCVRAEGRHADYVLVPAAESGTGKVISVSEADIKNIIRAKAAIYSGCSTMLSQLHLTFDNLVAIYIAGGFGRFLDIEKAIVIGLLPDLPREKFRYLGNTSLTGSYMALLSPQHREKQFAIARSMTYVDLSSVPAYMDQYTAALFLPHTDMGLFPSVRRTRLEH